MTTAGNTLDYARRAMGSRPPRSRAAVVALAAVLAHPVFVAVPLLLAADRGWLPQHFLCCRHPGLAQLAFMGLPLAGAVCGGSAALRIIRDRRRPRGIIAAAAAILLGCTFAVLGGGILQLLKA